MADAIGAIFDFYRTDTKRRLLGTTGAVIAAVIGLHVWNTPNSVHPFTATDPTTGIVLGVNQKVFNSRGDDFNVTSVTAPPELAAKLDQWDGRFGDIAEWVIPIGQPDPNSGDQLTQQGFGIARVWQAYGDNDRKVLKGEVTGLTQESDFTFVATDPEYLTRFQGTQKRAYGQPDAVTVEADPGHLPEGQQAHLQELAEGHRGKRRNADLQPIHVTLLRDPESGTNPPVAEITRTWVVRGDKNYNRLCQAPQVRVKSTG